MPARRPAEKKTQPSKEDDSPTPMDREKRKQAVEQPSKPATDANGSISTPDQNKKNARSSSVNPDSPSLKRPRVLRKHMTSVVYSAKWHPMDDILRPKRAAKVKNKGFKPPESVDSYFDLSEHEPVDHDDSDDQADGAPTLVKARHRSATRSPSPDRRRSRRAAGKAEAPNYSMKYHPMDAVTKPNASATIAAQAKTQRKRSLSSDITVFSLSSLSTLVDDGSTPELTTKGFPQPKPRSKPAADSKPSVSMLQHVAIPEHQEYNLRIPSPIKAENKTTAQRTPNRASTCHPEKDASSSSSVLQTPPHIPIDFSVKTTAKTPSKLLADPLLSFGSSPTSPAPPSWSSLQNPYIKQRALDPEKLEPLDQILYSFEKGAPVNSETLPHTWQEAKQLLFDHAEITLDDLNGKEATGWIKKRYEDARLGVEGFFGSESEPSTKKDWMFILAEGFDVFDKPSGVKYWKHRRHSIFDPAKIDSLDGPINYIREIPETVDEEFVHENGTTSTEDLPKNDFDRDDALPDGYMVQEASESNNAANADESTGSSNVEAQETSIVDLENFNEVDHEMTTLMEIMRAKDVTSSGTMMAMDAIDELLLTPAQFLDDNVENPRIAANVVPCRDVVVDSEPLMYSKDTQHVFMDTKSASQPQATENSDDGLGFPVIRRSYESQIILSEVSPRLLPAVDFASVATSMQVNTVVADDSEGSRPATALYLLKKRKSRTVSPEEIRIFEDSPDHTPSIRKIVARNPPSPGTDLPIENLEETQTSSQRSNQDETRARTPQFNRRQPVVTTPVGRRVIRPAIGNTAELFHSLFGGPTGPQSSSPSI